MEPEAFVKMLKDYLSPKFLVTGPNYSFGVKGLGTPDLLKELGENMVLKHICNILFIAIIIW